jgi:acetyl/propionyl-CoA carboxylase alpha subunit
MLAKVIAHGRNRDDAIRRLTAALEDAPLLGVANNGRFLRDLLDHERFRSATMHTALLDDWAAGEEPILKRPQPTEADWQLAAACSPGAGLARDSVADFELTLDLRWRDVRTSKLCLRWKPEAVSPCGRRWRVRRSNGAIDAHGRCATRSDGITRHAPSHRDGDTLHLARDAAVFVFREASPFPKPLGRNDPAIARAPVAGTVARLEVGAGDTVIAGQTLAVIEAMKMEMRVTAVAAGTVTSVRVLAGSQVAAGAILIELNIEESACLPTTKPS